MAIRFQISDAEDTDIVAHSYNGFPAATPSAFLTFLQALPDPEALERLAARDPAVRAFLDAPKPAPLSYATETFFGVNAFRFTNAEGLSRFARYRLIPLAGRSYLTSEESRDRPPGYLAQEFSQRVMCGEVRFRLEAQIAQVSDQVDDGSQPWPDDRLIVHLGTLTLSSLPTDQILAQRELRFVPMNLLDGIEVSGDPMLQARTHAYRISADRRENSQ